MKTRVVLAAAILTAVVGLQSRARALGPGNGASQQEAAVHPFGDIGTDIEGASSTLMRNDHGVTMTLHTVDLLPGGAYTVWWVVFNDPLSCAANPCGPGDFGAANASVLYSAGNVVGGNGTSSFASHLKEGDTDGALFGPGLVDARVAEIHLVVRSHGPAIPGLVSEQIHEFNGGCNPGDPNVCTDEQAVIHLP